VGRHEAVGERFVLCRQVVGGPNLVGDAAADGGLCRPRLKKPFETFEGMLKIGGRCYDQNFRRQNWPFSQKPML
jgi:hypothetical protein